ncbi:CTD nuclear envelope phosphatase 1A [Strongylocentrotus purpuratus]|uniref:protein-serine/threonine phosphatase n=1 Tax=Strongylocentrotus purpuratus TaxID=7668 RepID=A0A7M7P261_STRPU|nr:CTD nuclear envelope phosphatase 1A [Strongylocentrotus purpuratus]
MPRMPSFFLMGFRTVILIVSKIWEFFCYQIRKNTRKVFEYQTIRYDTAPLSPLSSHKLSLVKRKILVLDLDETLVHSKHVSSTFLPNRPSIPPDFVLKVTIDSVPERFYVYKRPHVDFFLSVVSQWFELVVFTASMEIYGSPVVEKLDNGRGLLQRRYYRQHCTLDSGSYTKDLSAVHPDLSSIFIVDNSPGAYRLFPDNGIPIVSWMSEPSDTGLLNLLPFLDALRFTGDIRSVLRRNTSLTAPPHLTTS